MSQPCFWTNGKRVSREDARVDLLANALHYGTGVFEGIRCYDAGGKPAIFQLEPHMERFARGTEALSMDVDVAALTEGIVETVAASGFKNAYIRPIAYFAAGIGPGYRATGTPYGRGGDAVEESSARALRRISSRYPRFRRNSARALPLKICGAM